MAAVASAAHIRARWLFVTLVGSFVVTCDSYAVTGGGLGHSSIPTDTWLYGALIIAMLVGWLVVPISFLGTIGLLISERLGRTGGKIPVPPLLPWIERLVVLALILFPVPLFIGVAAVFTGPIGVRANAIASLAFAAPPLLIAVAAVLAGRTVEWEGAFQGLRRFASRWAMVFLALAALAVAIAYASLLPIFGLIALAVVVRFGRPRGGSVRP